MSSPSYADIHKVFKSVDRVGKTNTWMLQGYASIAKDALLVGSLGVLIDAMLAAVEADPATFANLSFLRTIGR